MADRTDTFYAGNAFHGYGSQLMMGDGASPEDFEAVAEVISITFGDMTTAVIDKTHLRSPAAHREKLLGLRDSGPFMLRMNWAPAEQSLSKTGGGSGSFATGGLLYVWINRLEKNWKLVLSDDDTTELPFTGGVTKFQPGEIGPDGKVDLTVEITPLADFSSALP